MKIRILIFTVLVATILASCNKKEFDYPQGTLGISKITYFADLKFNGARYVTVELGDTYTEPGVTATENGVDIPVTITGTVDTNTPGVYTLVYSAVNKDGFSATLNRTVIVYSTSDDAAAHDFSGVYARTSNGVTSTWTKLAPGVYLVENPGGAADATLAVIAINPTDFEISIPEQVSNDGTITSSDLEEYVSSDPPSYKWQILNPGYGTAVRTFVKQ